MIETLALRPAQAPPRYTNALHMHHERDAHPRGPTLLARLTAWWTATRASGAKEACRC